MIVEQTVSIDIEDLFNSLSATQKAEFCDIALEWMDDNELFEVLDNRNPDWSNFGLIKEE